MTKGILKRKVYFFMKYYQRIWELRKDARLTQETLSQMLFIHKTTYTNYEQGKHRIPLDFAVELANFYHVSLDYIAGRSRFPNGNDKEALNDDEAYLLEEYLRLNEKNKRKLKRFLRTLQ